MRPDHLDKSWRVSSRWEEAEILSVAVDEIDEGRAFANDAIHGAASTSTRIDSLSMVGTWIGAALAMLTQEKPPVAASPIAVESFRKSRRANSFVIVGLS
jgi:hypothetical protein